MNKIDIENLIKKDSSNTEISVSDELKLKVIDNLLSEQNIKTNSRINKKQVSVITKLFMFSHTYKNNYTRLLADYILHLQVSLAGLGRKELVQILQTVYPDLEDDKFKQDKHMDVFR